jgi:4-amino-4-deoxy-L-arabinose transferase-like glycosyltransferase
VSRANRADWLILASVGLVAFGLRVAVILGTRHSFVVINDAADYWRLAASIAGGHGFGVSHVAPGGGPTALRPPAFPLLLALVVLIAGKHVLVARLLGAVLGAVTAVLVAVLVRQLGGDHVRSLIAGLIAAAFPAMVIASTSLMSEVLFVPVSLGVIVAALEYRRGNALWLPVSGLLLGVATLTRPVGAVLVLPVVLITWRRTSTAPRRWSLAAIAAALALAPCLAWEIRDIEVLHATVPLTTQSGYLLSGTYNATAAHARSQPGAWIVPSQDPAIARLVASHPQAGEVRLSGDLERAALRYASSHPGYIATVIAHNLLRLFDLTGLGFARAVVYGEFGYGPTAGLIEYISALILLALALLGLVLGGARGWPLAVAFVPVLLVLVTVPVQSFSRFRAPIDPYLVLLASAPVALLFARLSRVRRPAGSHLALRERAGG